MTLTEPARRLLLVVRRQLEHQHTETYGIVLRQPPPLHQQRDTPCKGDYRSIQSLGSAKRRDALIDLRVVGVRMAEMTSANMVDHVGSLRRMIDNDGALPRFSHWTVARTAVEAAARVHYLYALGEPWQVRLLRAGAAFYDDAQRVSRIAKEMPILATYEIDARQQAEESRRTAVAHRDHVALVLKDAGMVFHDRGRKKKAPTHLSCANPDGEIPLRRNLTAEINEICTDMPSVYARGSATVHSNMWHLGGILVEDPDHPTGLRPQDTDPPGICAAADVAIAACAVTTRSYGQYFGVDVEHDLTKLERRRRALVVALEDYYNASSG